MLPSTTYKCPHSLLTLGHRWKIGDGSQINLWSMPWISTLPTLKPTTLPLVYHEDITVNYSLNPGLNSWNISLVQWLSNPLDAASIFSIPLFTRDYTDKRIWKAVVDGTYTVKSTYRICSDLIIASFPTRSENCWNSI